MLLAGYGNLDEQFSEYLRWIKWVVRSSAHHVLAPFASVFHQHSINAFLYSP